MLSFKICSKATKRSIKSITRDHETSDCLVWRQKYGNRDRNYLTYMSLNVKKLCSRWALLLPWECPGPIYGASVLLTTHHVIWKWPVLKFKWWPKYMLGSQLWTCVWSIDCSHCLYKFYFAIWKTLVVVSQPKCMALDLFFRPYWITLCCYESGHNVCYLIAYMYINEARSIPDLISMAPFWCLAHAHRRHVLGSCTSIMVTCTPYVIIHYGL